MKEFSNSLMKHVSKVFLVRGSSFYFVSHFLSPFFPTMSEWRQKKPQYVCCQLLTYSPRLKVIDTVGIGVILIITVSRNSSKQVLPVLNFYTGAVIRILSISSSARK